MAGGEMKTLSRRDLIKTGLLAPAAVAAAQGMGPLSPTMEASAQEPGPASDNAASQSPGTAAGRERLLLDFG
jgi:beta-galactosidase